MNSHTKKIIAPIIVTSIVLLCFVGYVVACICTNNMAWIAKLGCGVIFLILSVVCICVLVERIKEIRSGEEDDLSKY